VIFVVIGLDYQLNCQWLYHEFICALMASSLAQLEQYATKETQGVVRRMIIRNKNECQILSTFLYSQLSVEQCVIISVPCTYVVI